MKTLVILGVVLGGLLLAGLGIIGYYNSIQTVGVQKELSIVAQNNSNTIELNGYVAGLYEQVGIANLKSQQMDKIISDAVKGRYDLSTDVNANKPGSFFSAIHEAYPNIDLSIYDKILDYVRAKRDAYTADQQKLQDMLRDFDSWRLSGFPHNFFVRLIGFPDSNLKAMNDQGVMLTGQSALDYLETISQPNGSNNGGGQRPVQIPGMPMPQPSH